MSTVINTQSDRPREILYIMYQVEKYKTCSRSQHEHATNDW